MTKEERATADKLIASVLLSFEEAWKLHRSGQSLDAILITHDIVAAASDTNPTIIELHRQGIRAACLAFDEKVRYEEARAYLWKRMQQKLKELLG